MILSVTLSKPVKNINEILGDCYTRVKIKLMTSSKNNGEIYFCEFFTEKQVFHKKFTQNELSEFLEAHAGTTFKACVERTETEEIQILANKKGKITRLEKKLKTENEKLKIPHSVLRIPNSEFRISHSGFNLKKNYILQEGNPVPFLVHLGIMTAEGKVISSKYDKFRQINRFLEFVDDIIEDILSQKKSDGDESPFSVVDFGSGKSYLTFAIHHYLSEIRKIPCSIFGLDLKKDVIDYCNDISEKLSLQNISFAVGDIASFGEDKHPDLVVTLHACDTATDFALDYSIRRKTRAILSVPCCQHEINSQLSSKSLSEDSKLSSLSGLLKYGLIKERFSALLTDSIRCELLEKAGYKVQILEFIDMENTPKNLLIRAVRRVESGERRVESGEWKVESEILKELGISQKLFELMRDF